MATEATLAAQKQCEMLVYFFPWDIFKQYDCETSISHLTTLLPCRFGPMYGDIKVHCIEGVEFFFFLMKYMYVLIYSSFYTERNFRETLASTRSYGFDVLHASLIQVLTMTLV